MRLDLPPGGRGDSDAGPLDAHSHAAGGADARVRPLAADAIARPVDVLVVRGDRTLGADRGHGRGLAARGVLCNNRRNFTLHQGDIDAGP